MLRSFLIVLAAVALSVGCEKKPTAALEADKVQQEQRAQLNRLLFTYPDAKITDTMADITGTTAVTGTFSYDPKHPEIPPAFSGGTRKLVEEQFVGAFSYQFMGRARDGEGDVYLFTIEPPQGGKEVIPYIHRGQPATIYDKNGVKLAMVDKK